jgi:type IV secretory pathway TrbL component
MSLIICIIGCILYLAASFDDRKLGSIVEEIARLMFAMGLLAYLLGR